MFLTPWSCLLLKKGERVAKKFLLHLKYKKPLFSKSLGNPFNDNAYSGGKLSDWNSCKAVDGFYSWFSLISPQVSSSQLHGTLSTGIPLPILYQNTLGEQQLSFAWASSVLMLVVQSCLTLCDPMDCSLPGSSVHGIIQARILEWVAISFFRGSSGHRDRTQVSRIVGTQRELLSWPWDSPGTNQTTAKEPWKMGGRKGRSHILKLFRISTEAPVPY